MTATRPQPRPGVLDIAPYIPGKSRAPGVAKIFKLSSNETPMGASESTIAAYRAVGEHLEDYPDGSASALREAIGDVFGLDPARIVCGAGSDDLLNLIARAYLSDGDEAIHTTHGFLVYPIATLGTGAKPVVAPEKNFTADVDAILKLVSPRTKMVFLANPNNPTGTYIPFDEVKRLHKGLPPQVLLVLDAAYAEYVQRNDYESGIELVATSENVVMCRTFSKIYGLAALRLGWMYGPAHCGRCDQPHSRAVQRQRAGDRRRHRGHPRHRPCRAFARAQYALARLAHRGDRQARTAGDAERGKFRAHPLSGEQGLHRQRGRRLPHQARADPAPGRRLQVAECLENERGHRGSQPAGSQGAC